jgi:hypothetical protein
MFLIFNQNLEISNFLLMYKGLPLLDRHVDHVIVDVMFSKEISFEDSVNQDKKNQHEIKIQHKIYLFIYFFKLARTIFQLFGDCHHYR